MKTNFLYFREKGSQTFIATANQTAFTINGDSNWDPNVTADTQVTVTVTDVSAGTTSVIADGAKALANTNDITLAAQGVGDIVKIELIPLKGTEAAFNASRFLGVERVSDTSTIVSFQSADGQVSDDTVAFTHTSDGGLAYNDICSAMAQAIGSTSSGFVTVFDRANNVGLPGMLKAPITKMLIGTT